MTQMTALRAHHRGGPETLTVESAPVPVPAAGEVLVEVHAAAITFDELSWEETWRADCLAGTVPPRRPEVGRACPRPRWRGGVGALAVQLAANAGAGVTATVRSDAHDLVNAWGARRVIDTRTEAFDDAGTSYDVVVDTVGGETMERSFAVLEPGGRLITLSAPPPAGMSDAFEVDATFFIVVPDHATLSHPAALVEQSRLHVEIAETFPLSQGRAAYESGRRPGRRPGKTVLTVRD